MALISCYVGELRKGGDSPPIDSFALNPPSSVAPQTIGEIFRQASGAAALEIEFNWSRRDSAAQIPHTAPFSVALLTVALSKLLEGPVKQPAVGLLLADYFDADLAQFGAMFDLDMANGVLGPRQGCAIFVGAIKDALSNAGKGDDPRALAEFIAYTAVHELGHSLNLWHIDESYMQPHPKPAAPGPYGFADEQSKYLALAANSDDVRFVLPGRGCSSYGQRPDGWDGMDDSNPFEGPTADAHAPVLDISVSHRSFHIFEPVELDLCLSLPSSAKKSVSVPNEIDPGYDNFQIWITEPSGERRRFRPQVRFCRSNGKRVVSPKHPYRRDISIFRQSGGSTFRAPGRHLIQVAFRTSAHQILWSNVAECEVQRAGQTTEAVIAGRELFESSEVRNLLRYKSSPPTVFGYAALTQFAVDHASEETAAAIHYALGKSFLSLVNQSAGSPLTHKWRERGVDHLAKARTSSALMPHRRNEIEKLLGGHDSTSRNKAGS